MEINWGNSSQLQKIGAVAQAHCLFGCSHSSSLLYGCKLHNLHPNLTFEANEIAGHIQVTSLVLETMSNANHEMTMIQHRN